MKIGILTYHRAHNFGALLQALATRITLERMGHEAFFVDYWPDYHKKRYQLQSPSILRIIRHPQWFIRFFRSKGNKLQRINKFETFIQNYVQPYCKGQDETFDVILYGSDQIWRKQKELNDYNDYYFGCRIKALKHIAFSASTDNLPQSDDYERFKILLHHYDKISVREDNLQNLCKELGFESELLIDPTFLLDGNEWVDYFNIVKREEKPYALFYIMKQGVFDLSVVKEFCNQKRLGLKILHGYPIDKDNEENISIADPRDLVDLIYNASFVFTSSFHGLAFAINMKKEFVVSTTFGTDRIRTLLDNFGLSERFVDGKKTIPNLEQIDYTMVKAKQAEFVNESMAFLYSNVKGNKQI